jgi:hypothetical protein
MFRDQMRERASRWVAVALTGTAVLIWVDPSAAIELNSISVDPSVAGPAPAAGSGAHKIGPGVMNTVRSGLGANVFIALKEPSVESGGSLSTLCSEVAVTQEAVLQELGGDGYSTTRRFAAVPALAGKVTTEAALMRIAAHPDVEEPA